MKQVSEGDGRAWEQSMIQEVRKDKALSETENKTAWHKNRWGAELRELMGDDYLYFFCEVGSSDAWCEEVWLGLILRRVHWFGITLRAVGQALPKSKEKIAEFTESL